MQNAKKEYAGLWSAIRGEAMGFLIDVQAALMKITPPPHRWVSVDVDTGNAAFRMFDPLAPHVTLASVEVSLLNGDEDPHADGGAAIRVAARKSDPESGFDTVFEEIPRNGTSKLYRKSAADLIADLKLVLPMKVAQALI